MNKQALILGVILGLTVGVFTFMMLPMIYSKVCNPGLIVGRRDAVGHHYYQLENGNGFWSDREFQIEDQVCVGSNEVISPLPGN